MIKDFTNDNFQEQVIEASKSKPVLVDFFAEWCNPCKMQALIIDQVAEEIGDKAIVGSLNTETGDKIAQEYDIMSIPTLIIFKDGKPVQTYNGVQTKEILIASLKNN
ncbi:MAG: thioredoxin [bacterium]